MRTKRGTVSRDIAKEAIINWKQKLGSRKFWVAVATFISALGAIFFDVTLPTEPMVAAGGILAAYMLGQSWVDKATVEGQANIIGNETLIQAQAYIKYLEDKVSELGEENAS